MYAVANWNLFARLWLASKTMDEGDGANGQLGAGAVAPEEDQNVFLTVSDVHLSPLVSVGACFVIAVIYVGSLYVWQSEHDR